MTRRARRHQQQGVASLIVVAVLFFILSLVAAYTNRNLIFEQRTAGNQYRSTQAFEAAEAGLEWALAMLNAGRIDDSCTPDDAGPDSFRTRYLTIDPGNGRITPNGPLTPDFASTVWASCVFNGADWNCICPTPGGPAMALAAPAGAGVFPAFRVRYSLVAAVQPGVVRIEVNGCTRLDNDCLNFPAQAVAGEGRATVSSLIALRSALPAPPAAALTVQGGIDVLAGALGAFNPDPDGGGISILAGGLFAGPLGPSATPPPAVAHDGPPGTPAASSLRVGEAGLAAMPLERPDGAVPIPPYRQATIFTQSFGIWPDLYRDQPATIVLDCSAGCNAADVRAAWQANPGRMLWADGGVTLEGGGDIGTAASPLLLVVAGSDDDGDGTTEVEIEINIDLHGALFVFADSWTLAGAGTGTLRGAAIGDGELRVDGPSFSTVYDAAVLQRLRWTHGSFVRVPGAWRDF